MPYCQHCGAPQLTLNAYAQPLSSAMEAAEIAAGLKPKQIPASEGVDWQSAITAAVQVSAVGGILMVLASVVPVSSTLTLLWLFAAALLTVGLYHRRSPKAILNAGVGARIGTVVGIFLSIIIVALSSASFVVDRYVMHQGDDITHEMQSAVNLRFSASMAQYKASGGADPQQLAALKQYWDYLLTPSGRATTVLIGLASVSALTLLFCLITGAIGGRMMLRRQNNV